MKAVVDEMKKKAIQNNTIFSENNTVDLENLLNRKESINQVSYERDIEIVAKNQSNE